MSCLICQENHTENTNPIPLAPTRNGMVSVAADLRAGHYTTTRNSFDELRPTPVDG